MLYALEINMHILQSPKDFFFPGTLMTVEIWDKYNYSMVHCA